MNGVLDELAKQFEFTLWATANTEKGKSYQYMDPIGINIIFNEWDQSFELKWLIPKSIFTIECPSCTPYTNKEHFKSIYLKFWRTIRAWNVNMPERYTREPMIQQEIFSEKPTMKEETWSGGGFGI